MKTFSVKAALLAGLTHVISRLTPEQKATAGVDPVDANRLVLKAVADCEKANSEFMGATKETSEKLQACFDGKKKEADELAEGKPQEEKAKIYAEKTNEYRKEAEEINKASKAEPEKVVTVELSDEKYEALKKVYPLTVKDWQDSQAFVDTADSLDALA